MGSCAENLRVSEFLEEALRACQRFDVDVLVLPGVFGSTPRRSSGYFGSFRGAAASGVGVGWNLPAWRPIN